MKTIIEVRQKCLYFNLVFGEKIISRTRGVEMFCSVPVDYNKRTSGYKKTGNVMG